VTLFNGHQNCRIRTLSVKFYAFITEKPTNIRISFGIRCYDATLVERFLFVFIILVLVWDWNCEAVRLTMGTWPVFRMMEERIWSCVVWELKEEADVFGSTPMPFSFCPSQIPHSVPSKQILAFALRRTQPELLKRPIVYSSSYSNINSFSPSRFDSLRSYKDRTSASNRCIRDAWHWYKGIVKNVETIASFFVSVCHASRLNWTRFLRCISRLKPLHHYSKHFLLKSVTDYLLKGLYTASSYSVLLLCPHYAPSPLC